MDVVRYLLIAVHLLGMAAIVGSWFTVLKSPQVLPPMVWGARVQVIVGFLLWGILESGAADDAGDPNRVKLVVKLLIGVAVAGLAESNLKKGTSVNPRIVHLIGGLAVVNVLVAVLWQ
jgi:hypothetical protein